jgi:hypothetical protein
VASRKRECRSRERFARIPVSVLESLAVRELNHAALRVLVILASQWCGNNNGTLAITESYARRFGLCGRDTLYRSLRELEAHGLIVRTRQGMKLKNHFSLWAISWEDITHRDGRPLDTPEPKNNRRWLEWKPESVPKDREQCEGKRQPNGNAIIREDGRNSDRCSGVTCTDDRE